MCALSGVRKNDIVGYKSTIVYSDIIYYYFIAHQHPRGNVGSVGNSILAIWLRHVVLALFVNEDARLLVCRKLIHSVDVVGLYT